MMDKKWCVYKHTCPNKKVYIGITNNVKRRWGSYGLDYEKCTNFFKAIRKFGWDNIRHEILVDDLSYENAEDLERKYIKEFDSTNPMCGYNMTTGGSNCYKTGRRRIIQYDYDGNIIATYLNQSEAANVTKIYQTTISKICLHKQRSTPEGYVFRYEGDPFNIDNCCTKQLRIPVFQLDINKNIICKYSCIEDASRQFGVHSSSIKSALNKEYRKCSNYYWCDEEHFDDFSPTEQQKNRRKAQSVSQYDLEGNYIRTFKSLREASDYVGINHMNISLVCKNERSQAAGYIWKYAD